MKLTLAEPKYLKDSISIISELVTETQLSITNTGVTIIAMDPANVAMVIYKLLSSCFSEFELEGPVDIGVNLNNFKQILRRVDNSDIVTLETDENEAILTITIKGKTVRRFNIPIIETDEKEQKEPNLEFAAEVTLPASTFASAIEDADIVADSVALIATKTKLTVAAAGDLNKVEVDIEGEDIIIENSAESVRAKYSIEYLKKMLSGSKISDEVRLSFNTNYPVKINFVAIDKMSLSFVLAPRVEEN
jgi:proliferating cell nuclear antigen